MRFTICHLIVYQQTHFNREEHSNKRDGTIEEDKKYEYEAGGNERHPSHSSDLLAYSFAK